MHTCNPWCLDDGIHALLFDSTITDTANLEKIGQALAASSGFIFRGVAEVRAAGSPAPGTRTDHGLVRGRMVVWAEGRVEPSGTPGVGRVAS